MFLFKLPISSNFIFIISIFSMIIGAIGGLNQSNIKIIIAYSGISHLGFILLSFSIYWTYFLDFSFFYFVIYIIANIGLLSIFVKKNVSNYLIEISNSFIKNKFISILIIIFLLSWLGLPPFSGFIGKWIIIIGSLFSNNLLLIFIIISSTLLTSFFYLRIILFLYLENFYINIAIKKTKNENFKNEFFFIRIINLLGYFSIFIFLSPTLIGILLGSN